MINQVKMARCNVFIHLLYVGEGWVWFHVLAGTFRGSDLWPTWGYHPVSAVCVCAACLLSPWSSICQNCSFFLPFCCVCALLPLTPPYLTVFVTQILLSGHHYCATAPWFFLLRLLIMNTRFALFSLLSFHLTILFVSCRCWAKVGERRTKFKPKQQQQKKERKLTRSSQM